MTNLKGPKGWHAGLVEKRFADTKPSSYDSKTRTVDAVISMGSPVVRFYGTEVLRITPEAVEPRSHEGRIDDSAVGFAPSDRHR